MNRIFIVGGVVAFLILIVAGVYVLTPGSDNGDGQKGTLQESLLLAQQKLNRERAKLDALTKGLQDSFPLAVSIQDQMRKSSDIVAQTDFMFTNPYGETPELVVKNPRTGLFINDERKDIDALLLEWQKKIDLLSVEEIDLAASEGIRHDIEKIQAYLKDLSEIVANLTPGNSGLSESQINSYSLRLPSVEAIHEVLASLETSIASFTGNNSQTTEENQAPLNPGHFSTTTPAVTPSQVVAQQAVVAGAQSEVTALEQQLAQGQTAQTGQTPVPVTPDPASTTNPVTDNQTTLPPASVPPRERPKPQGIIIQPGPPRLIQGTDAY